MTRCPVFLALLFVLTLTQILPAQTSTFSYQGRLTEAGNPANGAYQMQFKLYDSLAAGNQIGSTIADVPVTVTQGTFAVKLDFGVNALTGANRWLEIAVRHNSAESYTTLSPREQIASSPYAVRTLSASTADSATTAATATNALNLGGVAANQFVQTNDSRLSDARNPLPGSSNYIQNSTTTQGMSSFNISGNGTVLGVLSAASLTSNGLLINGPVDFIQGATTHGKLRIEGSGAFDNPTAARFDIRNTASTLGFFQVVTNAGNLDLYNLTPAFVMRVDQLGRVQMGEFQFTRLSLGNGDPWTTDSWSGAMSMTNASAIGWNFNASGQRFGIGQTAGGLFMFRTNSGFGSTASPAAYDLQISNSGFVGIGIGSLSNPPARLLHVNGRARIGSIPLEASSAQVCFNGSGDLLQCGASSLKWKSDISNFRLGLNVVRRLQPINFRWQDTGLLDFGLGAEDVAQIAPDLTIKDEAGDVKGVKYEKLNLLFINAIKEQQLQIERQQRQIDKLTRRLSGTAVRTRTQRRR